jgi:hypothetical protein
MTDGKAVIYNGKKAMKVEFKSYGSSKIISSPDVSEKYEGILVIFNSNEAILRKEPESLDNQELIDGLTDEISHSLTLGWKSCYFCSFEKHGEYNKTDLPPEFTTLDDDKTYCYGQNKLMARFINDSYPSLKKVRFVGIVSQDELDFFCESIIEKDKVEIETSSPYLIVV